MGSEAQEVNKVLGLLRNAFNLYIEINSEANPVDFDKLFDSMGAPALNLLSTGQHADADYAIFLDSTVHPLLRTVQSRNSCSTLANLIRLAAATINAASESGEGAPSVPSSSFQLTGEQRKSLVRPYDSDRVCLILRDRLYPYVRDFGNLQTWAVVRLVMAARGYFKVSISYRVFTSILVAVIPDYAATDENRLCESIRKNQHTKNITPECYPDNVDKELQQEGEVIEELLNKMV